MKTILELLCKIIWKIEDVIEVVPWCLVSRYGKLMKYIEVYTENKSGRVHLDNGFVLDFDTMTMYFDK